VERAKATFAEQPSIQAADALAWVQYNAGDIDGARTSIEQALRTGTRDNLILYHAGMIYHATGDEERARELLAVVVGSNPRFSVLHATAASDALADLEARALGHSAR
jgi:Flp pilus assembly protein TadD